MTNYNHNDDPIFTVARFHSKSPILSALFFLVQQLG